MISPGILDDEIKMVVWLDKVIDFAFIYSVIDDSAVQIRLRELGDARHSNAVEQIPFRTIQFQMLTAYDSYLERFKPVKILKIFA